MPQAMGTPAGGPHETDRQDIPDPDTGVQRSTRRTRVLFGLSNWLESVRTATYPLHVAVSHVA